MPGPQFFTPKSVRPARPKKRFTIAQANSALPLVRRIVTDIVRSHGQAMQVQEQLEKLAGARESKSPRSAKAAERKQQTAEQQAAQAGLERIMGRLEDFVDELNEVGCSLKDYQLGLIDFIGRHQGHDVCLCWKLGEEQVGFWHEDDAGFAGRQPVATLKETE